MKCIECHREIKIYSKKMCKGCYEKNRHPIKWANKYDFCIKCGTTQIKHQAFGLCGICYKKTDVLSSELCACGCGNFTFLYRGKPRKYLHGHWLRDNHSEITPDMGGRNNPQWGKFGKDHPAYGHSTTDVCRKQRSERALKRISSKERKQTWIEIWLSGILDSLALYHISQCVLADKFCVDEFLPVFNLVIEVNGDYWHGNVVGKLSKWQELNKKRDEGRYKYLETCGYSVLVLWESEIKSNESEAIEKIIRKVNSE